METDMRPVLQLRPWSINLRQMAPGGNGAAEAEMVLTCEIADGIGWLRLDRPQARNALNLALLQALDSALAACAADPAVHVVVIGATGPVFCSGHDLREMRADPGRESVQALFALCAQVMQRIVGLRVPVIACVQGMATAAGCQLVASCDLAVAAASARFATPGVNIGLFCSTPMVALSRAVGRKAAMAMLLTGETVDAAEARTIGLVNRVVPDAALEDTVRALARSIADKSTLTVAIGKAAFYRQAELGLADAYAYASDVMTENMMARDAAEGIDAFLQKRAPVWTGT
jgi:enoyl-CoA hydratase/carnithine racemase